MPDTYHAIHLGARFAELQVAYTGNEQIHLAAKDMLDTFLEERLEDNNLLLL